MRPRKKAPLKQSSESMTVLCGLRSASSGGAQLRQHRDRTLALDKSNTFFIIKYERYQLAGRRYLLTGLADTLVVFF